MSGGAYDKVTYRPRRADARNGVKLTEEQVRHIRIAYREQGHTYRAIAEVVGLTPKGVSDIVNRRTWKDI